MPKPFSSLRVAIIHYWFINRRGGEHVIDEILKLFPQADLYTHLIDREHFQPLADAHAATESFIARIPAARKFYQKLLPLMPLALEQFDLRGYDLIISSESGPAKGVLVDPGALHVCYCHSPMRYLWDMYHNYRENAGQFTRLFMPLLTHYLRIWDQQSANRVDYFIANSQFVKRRIRKTYRRSSEVIPPPVNVETFAYSNDKADYCLMLGQLTAYKRPDVAINAFAAMSEHKLIVIGEGELLADLRRKATSNVSFLGHQPSDDVRRYLQRARTLIFPGIEDFGIVPVEALACGTPVIAYGKGGILDSVTDGVTGLYFYEQTAESLVDAVARFDRWEPEMNRPALREAAEQFSPERFRERLSRFIARTLEADT